MVCKYALDDTTVCHFLLGFKALENEEGDLRKKAEDLRKEVEQKYCESGCEENCMVYRLRERLEFRAQIREAQHSSKSLHHPSRFF